MITPLQGYDIPLFLNIGRCPMLSSFVPSGLPINLLTTQYHTQAAPRASIFRPYRTFIMCGSERAEYNNIGQRPMCKYRNRIATL